MGSQQLQKMSEFFACHCGESAAVALLLQRQETELAHFLHLYRSQGWRQVGEAEEDRAAKDDKIAVIVGMLTDDLVYMKFQR
ncbi:hypothetical protein AKJ16_DCAP15405 [Drosera capensis]